MKKYIRGGWSYLFFVYVTFQTPGFAGNASWAEFSTDHSEKEALRENTIFWQTYHRPPGIIKKGEQNGQGFVQLILAEVTKQLPEYQHLHPMTTLARAMEDMKQGKNVCHPSLLVTSDREKFITFSQSSLFNPSNYVITRAELADNTPPKSIDIVELIHNSQTTFALIKGRAYGEPVDSALLQLDEERVIEIASDSLSVMFRLIALGRIDVTIAYPFELEYFTQSATSIKHSLDLLPVEGMPRFVAGSIGCSKTPWGEKVIAQVNQILTRIKPTKSYRQAMTRWWPESVKDEQFEIYYQTEFLNR